MQFFKFKSFFISIILLIFHCNGHAAVIFSDDFESDSSSWSCANGDLAKWDEDYTACGSTAGFGAEWKMGEGHNGGNAVYAWKNSSVPNGYRSSSEKWLSGSGLSQDVYHRWYMKVPSSSAFDKKIDEGFKFWRYLGRENGVTDPPEIYLNVKGDSFASGDLAIYNVSSGYLTLTPISSFNDNLWHCHELRLKWNDYGQSNGIIEYWLDGVKKASYTNISLGSVSGMKTYKIGVGIGNVSDSTWYQSGWSAVAFDDIVLSTSYVGPVSSATTSSATVDTVAPVVKLTTSNNTSISSNLLTVTGTASDNVSLSSCKWRIGASPDASNGTACTGTSSFSCSTKGYASGSNSLYVGCSDSSGNWGRNSITVTYSSSNSVAVPAPSGFGISTK